MKTKITIYSMANPHEFAFVPVKPITTINQQLIHLKLSPYLHKRTTKYKYIWERPDYTCPMKYTYIFKHKRKEYSSIQNKIQELIQSMSHYFVILTN